MELTMIANADMRVDGRVFRSLLIMEKVYKDISLLCPTKLLVVDEKKLTNVGQPLRAALTHRSGFFFYITFLLKASFHVFKNRRNINSIYLHDYYAIPLLYLFKFFGDFTFYYDMHELSMDKKKVMSIRSRIFYLIERIALVNAKEGSLIVIYPSRKRRTLVNRLYRLNHRSMVIPNISEMKPSVKQINYQWLETKSKICLVYQGVLVPSRYLDKLIFAVLAAPDVELTIIGDGPYANYLRDLSVSNGAPSSRIKFLGRLDREFLKQEISKNDFGVVAYEPVNLNNKYAAPNKIDEYIKSGVPIITNLSVRGMDSTNSVICDFDSVDALQGCFLKLRREGFKFSNAAYIDEMSFDKVIRNAINDVQNTKLYGKMF